MKNILTITLSFFKKAFSNKYIKFTLSIIILILIVLNLKTCNNLNIEKSNHNRDNTIYENNLIAMNDSITTHYDKKLNKIVSEKTSLLIKNVNDLQNYNKEMYNEFKNIKNMVAGIQSQVKVNLPNLISTIKKSIQDPNDSTKFNIPFEFNYIDEGLTQKLIGYTKIDINNNYPTILTSILDSNYFNLKLRYVLTETDNKYIVKAFSPSSLVQFNELDGAMMIDKISPSKTSYNKFAFGPYVGLGLNTNLVGGDYRLGWSVGFAATYNIFNKK